MALFLLGLLFTLLVALITQYVFLSRTKAEDLIKTNYLIETILQSAQHMIISTDKNGVVTLFNKAAEQALQYHAEDIINKQTPAIWHDPDEIIARAKELSAELGIPIAPGFDVFIAKAQQGIIETLEWTLIRKDKTRFPVRLTPTALKNSSQIIGYLGILEDISERKESERQMTLLASIVECSDDGMISKQLDGTITTWNKGAEKLFGYTAKDMIGKNIRSLIPLEKITEEETILKTIRAGKAIQQLDSIRVGKDNKNLHVSLTISPIFDHSNHVIGASKIVRDITERKQQQKKMSLLRERLLESNTELERFAYIASHDLQEPIRMITNFSEIIATDYANVLDEDGRECLRFIIHAGIRMHEMIDDLLAYSRLPHHEERMKLFKGESIMREIKENLKNLLIEKKVVLTHDTLPQMYGNPVQVLRLLQNLVINGIKYQPVHNTPHIHVSVEENAEYWCILVKDNGLGIKPEFINVIFQPFKRLHTWDAISGTGLGLAICEKIAKNHGGFITVTSELGKGSTFSFFMSKQLGGVIN